MSSSKKILEIKGLTTAFQTAEGRVRAVEGLDLDLFEGQTLGLVGESGCGKSVSCMSILRLIPTPPGEIEAGSVLYTRGESQVDLLTLPMRELRKIRGNEISMIFQEPMTSLNPVFTIGSQISEVVELHKGVSRREGRKIAIEMLDRVRIPSASTRIDDYPHQLSGGMRQRVMIAMALACNPRILIADEPTTALDVTIQAQILDLLRELQSHLGMAMILITHDLGVVAQMADQVAVMYAGRLVESASVSDLFQKPMHPYTLGLMESIPKAGRLKAIPGLVPSLLNLKPGCRFLDRCEYAIDQCQQEPDLRSLPGERKVRCVRDKL